MLSYFGSSLLFNEIEYFTFINLLLLSLFFFYICLFFIIFNSSLLLNSIYFNDLYIELIITFLSLIYVIIIISPGLLLFLDFDLITSSSFICYVTGFQWAWSYSLTFVSFSDAISNISFDQLLISSSLFNLSSFNLVSSFINHCLVCYDNIFGFSLLFKSFYLCLFSNYLILSCFSSINLIGSSFDVIHSFGFHNLGFKSDVIPGRLNFISNIFINFSGSYLGYCYELCGLGHTYMLSNLVVLLCV